MSSIAPAHVDEREATWQALHRIASALADREPAADLLARIAREARELTGVPTVAVGILDETRSVLRFVAAAGDRAEELSGLRIHADESIADTSLRTGRTTFLPDGSSDAGSPVLAFAPGGAVVPILQGGEAVGVLLAISREAGSAVTEEHSSFLRLLADQAALALSIDALERERSAQHRELSVLHDTARAISGTLNLQEVLDGVLDAICRRVEQHSAALFLLNDERTHLFIAADRGLTEDGRETQISAESPATRKLLEEGEPCLILDTGSAPGFEDLSLGDHIRSAMAVPLRSRADSIGLLLLGSSVPGAFSEGDLQLVQTVASHAGAAISNALLHEEATRQIEQASALYELSQNMNSTLELDRVYDFSAQSVMSLLQVDGFTLMLLDEEERLVSHVVRGLDAVELAAIQPRVGQGISGWVFEWMTPTAVADVAADARNRSAPIETAGVSSAICVPLTVGDEVIGVLLATTSYRRLFTVSEMELLYTVSNHAAVAISNARRFQEARARTAEMRRYFRRVATAMGRHLDGPAAPQLLVDLAIEVMRADRCAIYGIEGENAVLRAASGFRPSHPPDESMPLGKGLTGWVARRGNSLAVEYVMEDARSEAHAWLAREGLSSYLAIPLKQGRATVGVLEVMTQEPRAFSSDEVTLLKQFAARTGVANRLHTP